MSGGKGGSQTTQVEIPSWIQQPSIRNMARAEALQKVGYQPYMGPDVAGFTQPQQQAMQSNLNAAAAFGLVDPGMDAMAGMPQATPLTYDADGLPSRTGLQGYSSYPMYQKAVDDYEAANPGQARQYNNLFVNPQSGLGGTTGSGMMGGGINSGGQNNSSAGSQTGDPGDVGQFTAFDPTNYSISDANPYGVNFTAQAPDMTGYITADQLDQRLSAMQPTAPQDLSGYATTEQLNTALSGLPTYQPQDLSGYARTTDLYDDSQLRQDINSRFSNVNTFDPSGLQAQITANQQGLSNIPQYTAPDLSNFVTTDQFNTGLDTISQFDPSDLSAQISANQQAINNIPTYNAPDLSNYAQMSDLYDDSQLRQDINSRFSNIPQFDASGLQSQITANQQGLANLPTVSAPDLSGYATTNDLTQAIAGLPPAQMPDLSGYATTNDLTSAISGLDIPAYTAPDLSGYATTNDLTSAISGIDIPSYTPPDLSGYATTNDLTSAISGIPSYQAPDLSGYATTGDLTSAISGIPQFDPTSLQNQITANQTAIGNVPQYNDQGLLAAIQANQNAISGINTYDDTQLRQDINNRFSNFNPNVDLSNYATNASVDTLVNNLPTGQPQDLSNYVTNEQLSQGLQNLPTPTAPDLSGYATTQDLNTAIGGLPTYQAPDLSNYATQSDLSNINTYDDTQLRQDINNRFDNFTPNVDLSNYATNASVDTLMSNLPTYTAPDLSGYATTSQLDSAINALPTYTAPDLSGYATNAALQQGLSTITPYNDTQLRQDIDNRFDNFTPNVDLSNYVTSNQLQQGLSSFTPYNDEALRADINSRFGNISTFDPTGLQAQILALQNANNVVAPLTPQTIAPQQAQQMGPAAQTMSAYTMPAAQGLSFVPKGI